jgi:alkylated DNA repair dioxygenase AlkB
VRRRGEIARSLDHTPDLFSTALIPGLIYKPDLLSKQEEAGAIARFAGLPFKPFEFHGHLGNRRVVSFGWRYDYGAQHLQKSAPIPDFIKSLREVAAIFSGLDPGSLEHALVTEYTPGAGFGWHRDKAMFDHVVAFSFLSSCRLRFRRRAEKGWDRRDIIVEPCSGYLLSGEARSVWEHSIPPAEQKRYSLTFRDLRSSLKEIRSETQSAFQRQSDRGRGG